MKKKIAIIGTVGVPAKYGGFETLVDNLLDLLPEYYDTTVFCESKVYKDRNTDYKGAKLVYLNIKANGLQSVFYDIASILKSFRNNDILMILGVSGTLILPLVRPFFKGKIITNIDGLEWKRDKWNWPAKKFLKFSEKIAVLYSDKVVADNLYIKKHIEDEYKRTSYLIPYGGDHARKVEFTTIEKVYGIQQYSYFFTVCRIEPENNLDLIVQAYEAANTTCDYIIIGNFGSSDYGRSFKEKYKEVKGLLLLDPIYDQNVLGQFRSNCYFYLHGHSAGGTNPSLVEAMYLGLPIIAYGVNYNRATTNNSALYFDSAEELNEILSNLNSNIRELNKAKMEAIAKAEYTWENVCLKYMDIFDS